MALSNPLTKHPHDTGETYFEHMRVALGFARQTMGASLAALVHAFLPMFHQTTASERIRCLNRCLENGDRDAITIVRPARDTVANTDCEGALTA